MRPLRQIAVAVCLLSILSATACADSRGLTAPDTYHNETDSTGFTGNMGSDG